MPRVTEELTTGTWTSNTSYPSGEYPPYKAAGERDSMSRSVSRSDVVRNKAFPNGWRNPTNYSVRDIRIDQWYGTTTAETRHFRPADKDMDYITVTSGTYGRGSPFFNYVPLSFSGQNDVNRSLIEALNKVKDMKINLAQAFAERRQTADLIADNVARVMRAYSQVRRGKVGQAFATLGVRPRKLSKDASSRWLEMQYGWLPLLSDIHGGYEEVTRPQRDTGFRFKVSRSISNKQNGRGETSNGRQSYQWEATYGVKTVLWFEVDNPALLAASQTGLTDPLTILWELTPWSFVIDWLLPVGNMLDALTAQTGVRFISGTVTKTIRGRSTGAQLPFIENGGSNETKVTSGATASSDVFLMDRSVIKDPPAVGPQNLYIKNPFSTTHVANALALWKSSRK